MVTCHIHKCLFKLKGLIINNLIVRFRLKESEHLEYLKETTSEFMDKVRLL